MTAFMGQSLRPQPPYFMRGILVCPDCGCMWWGSTSCRCGAALHRRRPHYIDATIARHCLIERDGSAALFAPRPK